ncbi:MAG TPA: glycosyltransferase family 39 protein, partial [Ktedonobacterales bacterium]|nr:glycosyltransferase family 39 protein [Ktedonobacterales bacterium]
MEQNEDIALSDQDTVTTTAMIPGSPAAPAGPAKNTAAIDNVETAHLPILIANDISNDISMVETARLPTVTEMLTMRMPAVSVGNTVANTPTARVPAATATTTATATSHGRIMRAAWLRYPEFWLAVALAAFLRLWRIDLTQVLDDQGQLLTLARDAWLHHALPVTGIPSSIGTLNPPLSIYLLMPFTLFGKDPLPAAIAIALWNVLGVAFCYIFAQRYFGRIIAASGALLFATSGMAVSFSRFIWQQNWLPPVVALWILTLYLGCVSTRRGWFVPHIALLAIAILLHPAAALLIPISLVGFILTPRQALPSRRGWVIATGLVALMLAPTVLWVARSSASDIRIFAHYAKHGSTFNLDVFGFLINLLGAPSPDSLGQYTLYAQTGSWSGVVNAAMALCFAGGMFVLTERLARVSYYIWREGAATASGRKSQARAGALAVWHGLRAESIWRAHLLLWLSVVVPIMLLVRHNSDLHIHYLLILYPAVFIASGFAFQSAFRQAGRLIPRAITAQRLVSVAIGALLTALVLAQAFQSVLYPATLASGSFNAFITGGYGYPLSEVQQLNSALSALQAEQNTRKVFVSLSQSYRVQPALDYLTIRENSNRVGFNPECLVLPAPDEQPALVVATQPAGLANSMIASLPGLTPVANLAMAGSDDIAVYRMDEKLPPLLGERSLAPVTFTDTAGNGLRLDAVAMQPDGLIRLRWTVLDSDSNNSGTPWYHIVPTARAANGSTRALSLTDCRPTRWHAGETVFTWITAGDTATIQTLLIQVR